MTRLDQLQEQQLEETIKDYRRQIDELKGRQLVGGSSLVFHLNQTNANGGLYDVGATYVPVSPYAINHIVTFTPDTVQKCYAKLFIAEYYTDLNHPVYANFGYLDGSPYQLVQSEGNHVNDPRIVRWSLVTYFNVTASNTVYYFKFYVIANDTGTITWQTV